ncbi:serine hydrolase domain-containing protein [Symbioplanes lichenis]|uniref:serine hydrolase domain-containing protein n=1 Tax=Symbioplanes lichenis TaxID=1629072 RepID=UPI0027382C2F|nr:serine hydrolase domain-containing protein [Actinoplanes lichenis]
MTLHEVLAARVERGELPGAVTLVARGDDVQVDAIGTTAFGGAGPMRRDTVFRIASLTKPLLAALTMVLVEDDVIDLEEPVHRLLPELAGQRVLARPDGPLDKTVPLDRPVTVEDLLTFRLGSGMVTEPVHNPPWPVLHALREQQVISGPPYPPNPLTPDEWIRRFAAVPLMYQPGQKWQYNTGSDVLGVLLARAGGRPLGDVFRERLLDPLGLRATGFTVPAGSELPPLYGTDQESGTMVEIPGSGPETWIEPPVFPSGSGGLVSTVDDYHTFARMLRHKGVHGGTRILSEKSVELITSNHLTPEQITGAGGLLSGAGWGFGVAVVVAAGGIGRPGQYGWSGGTGTDWFNDPREDLTAILFTQVNDILWNGTLTDFQREVYA